MDTFAPAQPPEYDSNSIKESPRTISATFGDGYAIEFPDGLNANDATASFAWANVTSDVKSYIVQFYKSHIGKSFLWDAPGDEIGSGKWRFTDISVVNMPYDLYSITCNFKRSFELS